MTRYKDAKLIDFIPEHLKSDKKVIALCEALDYERNKLDEEITKINLYEKLKNRTISNEEVELLLWENHVDYYDSTLTLEQKIDLIETSMITHQLKGTKYAIEKHLDTILKKYKLLEWYEFDSIPGTFKIVGEKMPSLERLEKVFKIVNEYKKKSAHCLGFIVNTVLDSITKVGFIKREEFMRKVGLGKGEFLTYNFMKIKNQFINRINNYISIDLGKGERLSFNFRKIKCFFIYRNGKNIQIKDKGHLNYSLIKPKTALIFRKSTESTINFNYRGNFPLVLVSFINRRSDYIKIGGI